jgi:hypothetical protein
MSSRLLFALAALSTLIPAAARASAPARCYTSELAFALGPAQGAAGSIAQTVHLRNVSTRKCTLQGYPGLQMLNASGQPITTRVHRGASVTVSARPLVLITLAPGRQASFDIGYADATGYGNERCPASARVEITPPNDYRPLTVKWSLQPYGGSIPHLECGLINVSPVYG